MIDFARDFWRKPNLRTFWNMLFPPHISPEYESCLLRAADDTRIAAAHVEKVFEGISNKATAAGQDPLAVLIHDVKSASFRRHLERGGPPC